MKISGVESFCVVTRDGKPWVVLFDKFYFCGFDDDDDGKHMIDLAVNSVSLCTVVPGGFRTHSRDP